VVVQSETPASGALGWYTTSLRDALAIFDKLHNVEDALREFGLSPDALELEITENVAFNHGSHRRLFKSCMKWA
jgi:EAL domain-containing protein (putative c-di-GMP-specific phosphodiesterase class I)